MIGLLQLAGLLITAYFAMALVGITRVSVKYGAMRWVKSGVWAIIIRTLLIIVSGALYWLYVADLNAVSVGMILAIICVVYIAFYGVVGIYIALEGKINLSQLVIFEWSSVKYGAIPTLVTVMAILTLTVLSLS